LLDRDGVALSVQVLQEFYVQATRPTRPDRLPHEIAAGLVAAWTRFRVQAVDLRILAAALEITKVHGYSYWDSAIIAAARALGCAELYTEDLAHGHRIDGVTIVDPFR
jgi:predicted nucleic acid-binding protein